MKKVLVNFAAVFVSVVMNVSFAQGWEWTRVSGGSGNDESAQVCTDADGNVYQTGTFYGTASFQGTVLNSVSNGTNWFLAKYNADGDLIWVRNVLNGNTNYKLVKAITADVSGNIYIAGEYDDTVLVGGTQLITSGYYDVFLAKFDASGNTQWVETGGGLFDERAFALTTDPSGNIYLAGCFTEEADFDTVSLTGSSVNFSDDAMLLCYNASGQIQYGKSFGGISYERATDVAYYNNSLYLTGYFASIDASFGAEMLHCTNGGNDLFLARLNMQGDIQWVDGYDNLMSTSYLTRWPHVAVNNDGLYFTAPFDQTINLGSGPLTTSGSNAISFISKFDVNGSVAWVSKLDNRLSASVKGLTATDGHVFTSVDFVDTLKIGAQQFIGVFPDPAYAENNICVISWNSNGSIDWTKMIVPYENAYFVGGLRSSSIAALDNDVFLSAAFTDTLSVWPWFPVAEDILTEDVLLAKIDITANAIEQNYEPIVSVFPVPATDVITISSAQHGSISCEISDLYGKCIRKIIFNDASNNSIDVSDLEKGVYFLTFHAGGNTTVSTFIKQ